MFELVVAGAKGGTGDCLQLQIALAETGDVVGLMDEVLMS